MSLAINVDRVVAVLVAGVWYRVGGASFDIDSYEFVAGDPDEQPPIVRLPGGSVQGVPSAGATWTGDDERTFCVPLTAIQAVEIERP